MKKIFGLLLVLFVMCLPLFSEAEESLTLLNAQTSTGLGSEYKLDKAYQFHRCMALWGGTIPTNIRFGIHFTDESEVYDTVNYEVDITITSSPWRFYMVNKGGKFVKGNYISKSGGDGTTSMTLKCAGEK